MSTLTQQQIDHLRQLMDERRARELEEIRSVAERARDDRQQTALAGPAADRLDEALREIAQSSYYAIVRQNVEDVRDIEEARKRMAAGTYGVCTDCGREIGYQRLLAYPTAKRCINCQMEVERKRAASQGRSAS
ncbi:MAG TPA: TraR/DksA family transcriptional regulator [Steroidobacteraceae bacterium]|jgi:RNA polymerase-binding protein DksA